MGIAAVNVAQDSSPPEFSKHHKKMSHMGMSHMGGGHRTPSLMGSRQSVYSQHTLRTIKSGPKSHKSQKSETKWYMKPIMKSAIYTDLQRGAWHIAFYTLFLSIWTIFTSGFDIYCLHEASPGTEHTGYYIISFDFVYVGNAHIRGLLIMSSVFSLLLGIGLFITNVLLLDGLRKEQESGFKGWLWIMGIFTPWKILAWGFAGIVNDMIFAYNIIMLIAWFFFNVINVFSFLCVYSLYLELTDLTNLDHAHMLKAATMSTMNSRAASTAHGSRPTSPYVVNMQHGGVQYQHPPQQRDYGYSGGQQQHSGDYSTQI